MQNDPGSRCQKSWGRKECPAALQGLHLSTEGFAENRSSLFTLRQMFGEVKPNILTFKCSLGRICADFRSLLATFKSWQCLMAGASCWNLKWAKFSFTASVSLTWPRRSPFTPSSIKMYNFPPDTSKISEFWWLMGGANVPSVSLGRN